MSERSKLYPGRTAAQTVADVRFRRNIQALYDRGPRLVAEALAATIAVPLDQMTLDQRLDRFLALSDKSLHYANGRRLPPVPLHVVEDEA